MSDDNKRREYDTFGTTSTGPGASTSGFQGFHSTIDPEELFRNIFGDFAKMRDFGKAFEDFDFGGPQETTMTITFREAARGCEKDVRIQVLDTCPKCKGTK